MKKALVTGGHGQLGNDLQQALAGTYECLACGKAELDIAEDSSVRALFQQFRPDFVINAAAYTKVDASETNREEAWRVNAEGPRVLARHCRSLGIPLVHISTDYVFDGLKPVPQPYVETDATLPLGYYGVSKLAGETAIAEETDLYVIVRTAWLYGRNGPNFLKTMLRLAVQGKPLKVVNDQYGALTWTHRLAEQIQALIGRESRGIYHASAEGFGTWYEGAKFFLEAMGIEFRMTPCATEDYPTPARRPKNSILENFRLKEEGINLMVDWKQDVARFAELHGEALLQEAKGSPS